LVYLTAIDDISIFPNNEPIKVPDLITHNKEVSHFSCVKHTDKNTIKFLSPAELLNRILKYYGSFELEKIGIGKDIEYKLHREFKFIELFDERKLAGTITTIYLEKFDIKIQLTFNLINEKSAEIIKSIKEQCTLENDNFFEKTIEEKLEYIFNETSFDDLMTVYEYIQNSFIFIEKEFLINNLIDIEVLKIDEVKKNIFDKCNDLNKKLETISDFQINYIDYLYEDGDLELTKNIEDLTEEERKEIIKNSGISKIMEILNEEIYSELNYPDYNNFIDFMELNEDVMGTKRYEILYEMAKEAEDMESNWFDEESYNFGYIKSFWLAYLNEAISKKMSNFLDTISELAIEDIVFAAIEKYDEYRYYSNERDSK
jgi:hypothetical protein